MTLATVRAAVEHAVRQGQLLPHQLAAFTALDKALSPEQRQAFTDDWRAAGSPAQPVQPSWLIPARSIVKTWEGCKLTAYRCPAGVWTIGWGHTGPDVRQGMTITQARADELLDQDLARFAGGIHSLLPGSERLGSNQQAALISWAFNVGLGAVETSTLRRQVQAGESYLVVVQQELPRWNKVDGKELAGLTRRRAAEVALFVGGQPTPPAPPVETVISRAPYFFQRDSATAHGDRMCFSSTCAMAVETLKPGTLTGAGQPDDRYLLRLMQLGGETTSVSDQVRTLRSMGIEAAFHQALGEAHVEAELRAGRPVPVGWVHQGPIDRPVGDGHWSLLVGFTSTHWILHDPFGEAALVPGGYASTAPTAGRFVRYSRRNFNRRWMVEPYQGAYRFAPGKGWGLLLRLA